MKRNRRQFLAQSALGLAGCALLNGGCSTRSSQSPRRSRSTVMTVRGAISPDALGVTLPHEHIFLDFIGADQVSHARYDVDEVCTAVLPHLEQYKSVGGRSLVECTPACIGRDPLLLRRLAETTGLQILTNTGYYGAGKNKFLPRHAYTETAEQLSARWLREWHEGIEGTTVRPGFIKIGVEAGPLSDLHRKLVQAAGRTHLASGLTIAAHTGDGLAALDELATLKQLGVAPSAFIWVHAQNEKKADLHFQAASEGAWVEFDHITPKSVAEHVQLVQSLKARGALNRVLVSHDGGWYEAGKPHGGDFRPYDTLFKEFIPALKRAGFSEAEVHQLLVVNPREAFSIRPLVAR